MFSSSSFASAWKKETTVPSVSVVIKRPPFFFSLPLLLLPPPSSGDSRVPLGQLPRPQDRGTARREAERDRGDPAPAPPFHTGPFDNVNYINPASSSLKLLQWTASYAYRHFIMEKKMMTEKEWRAWINSTFTVNQYTLWLCFTRSSKLTLKFRFTAVFKLPGNFWEAENSY